MSGLSPSVRHQVVFRASSTRDAAKETASILVQRRSHMSTSGNCMGDGASRALACANCCMVCKASSHHLNCQNHELTPRRSKFWVGGLLVLTCLQEDGSVVVRGVWVSTTVATERTAERDVILHGRSPTMRHVSRTHRVALDWLFDRINLDPRIQIKYVDTKNQLADNLTNGSFTRDEWNRLLCLFNTLNSSMSSCCHFSQINDPQAMSKRQILEGKPGEDECVFCKIETCAKSSLYDSPSVSNSAESELISKAGGSYRKLRNSGFIQHRETCRDGFEEGQRTRLSSAARSY